MHGATLRYFLLVSAKLSSSALNLKYLLSFIRRNDSGRIVISLMKYQSWVY